MSGELQIKIKKKPTSTTEERKEYFKQRWLKIKAQRLDQVKKGKVNLKEKSKTEVRREYSKQRRLKIKAQRLDPSGKKEMIRKNNYPKLSPEVVAKRRRMLQRDGWINRIKDKPDYSVSISDLIQMNNSIGLNRHRVSDLDILTTTSTVNPNLIKGRKTNLNLGGKDLVTEVNNTMTADRPLSERDVLFVRMLSIKEELQDENDVSENNKPSKATSPDTVEKSNKITSSETGRSEKAVLIEKESFPQRVVLFKKEDVIQSVLSSEKQDGVSQIIQEKKDASPDNNDYTNMPSEDWHAEQFSDEDLEVVFPEVKKLSKMSVRVSLIKEHPYSLIIPDKDLYKDLYKDLLKTEERREYLKQRRLKIKAQRLDPVKKRKVNLKEKKKSSKVCNLQINSTLSAGCVRPTVSLPLATETSVLNIADKTLEKGLLHSDNTSENKNLHSETQSEKDNLSANSNICEKNVPTHVENNSVRDALQTYNIPDKDTTSADISPYTDNVKGKTVNNLEKDTLPTEIISAVKNLCPSANSSELSSNTDNKAATLAMTKKELSDVHIVLERNVDDTSIVSFLNLTSTSNNISNLTKTTGVQIASREAQVRTESESNASSTSIVNPLDLMDGLSANNATTSKQKDKERQPCQKPVPVNKHSKPNASTPHKRKSLHSSSVPVVVFSSRLKSTDSGVSPILKQVPSDTSHDTSHDTSLDISHDPLPTTVDSIWPAKKIKTSEKTENKQISPASSVSRDSTPKQKESAFTITDWSVQEVNEWLTKNKLQMFSKDLWELDGSGLLELVHCHSQSLPMVISYFKDLGYALRDNLQLCASLRALGAQCLP